VPADVNSAGHIDTALPAELTWGTLATKSGAVTPNYAGGSCSTTYCHGTGIKNNWPGATGLTPTWNDTTYLAGATAAERCSKCHGYPPGGGHTPLTNCAQCHNHVNATNDGFINPALHVNMIVEVSADNCTDCHTNANLSAAHLNHADPNTVLAGKKISTGDYGQAWFYSQPTYVNGAPKYSCGYCHPSTAATHMNSTINLNLDPTDPGATGTVKAKNGTPNFTQNPGVSVTCSSVYCHSNGFTPYAYKTTPNWFGGAFAGDGCAACHGNSPNTGGNTGSPAHGAHVVGIHYKDVFSGTNGKVAQSGAVGSGAAHGDPATSTTINCNVCHNSTVAVAYNDSNTVCVTCHTGAAVKGTMVISTTSTSHINGTPDVAFGTFSVNSKSQLRDSITSVAELNNSWTRTNGYKTGATSHDSSKGAPTYAGGSCSTVDCHNGNSVSWSAGALDCGACHTALPQ
jgi:predicted CxxxxCH...CXXCH cytochrome family protein